MGNNDPRRNRRHTNPVCSVACNLCIVHNMPVVYYEIMEKTLKCPWTIPTEAISSSELKARLRPSMGAIALFVTEERFYLGDYGEML